jgi:4-amino-4-deoxy-L-arabinose transferase-like glycosyltransferase
MRERLGDYAVLLLVVGLVSVPGLGRYSLWDVDEGVNAEAAREMAEADSWIVPTFNYQLRTAKPVLLYWLQRLSYAVGGVTEGWARGPSVLCGLGAVLLCYELGRRLWDRASGLWAGVILGSAVQFAILSRAATPDAPLLFFTVLTFLAFWWGQEQGRRAWWYPVAVACGLAVLTKGPIGVALPGLVILLDFLWQKDWRRLLDWRLVSAAGLFLLVAGPWYALVASETRGEWVKAFIGRENLERFARPMEGHSGPFFYYLLILPVFFLPWSLWLIPVLEHTWQQGVGRARRFLAVAEPSTVGEAEDPRPYRFLVCWLGVYLLVFSAAATKLPNYIFPLYPALALLTGRFFVRWQREQVRLARWVVPTALGLLAAVGAGVGIGLLVAERWYTGLGLVCWLGLIPAVGAAAGWQAWKRGEAAALRRWVAGAGIAFVAASAAVLPVTLDRHRAPKGLVEASGIADPQRDLRVGTHRWFAPSLVFYSGREVMNLPDATAVRRFLETPTPAYLFLPASAAEEASLRAVLAPHTCLARQYDLLARGDILVVANAAALTPSASTPSAGTPSAR